MKKDVASSSEPDKPSGGGGGGNKSDPDPEEEKKPGLASPSDADKEEETNPSGEEPGGEDKEPVVSPSGSDNPPSGGKPGNDPTGGGQPGNNQTSGGGGTPVEEPPALADEVKGDSVEPEGPLPPGTNQASPNPEPARPGHIYISQSESNDSVDTRIIQMIGDIQVPQAWSEMTEEQKLDYLDDMGIPLSDEPLLYLPKTGDESHTSLWFALMFMSMLGIAALEADKHALLRVRR